MVVLLPLSLLCDLAIPLRSGPIQLAISPFATTLGQGFATAMGSIFIEISGAREAAST